MMGTYFGPLKDIPSTVIPVAAHELEVDASPEPKSPWTQVDKSDPVGWSKSTYGGLGDNKRLLQVAYYNRNTNTITSATLGGVKDGHIDQKNGTPGEIIATATTYDKEGLKPPALDFDGLQKAIKAEEASIIGKPGFEGALKDLESMKHQITVHGETHGTIIPSNETTSETLPAEYQAALDARKADVGRKTTAEATVATKRPPLPPTAKPK